MLNTMRRESRDIQIVDPGGMRADAGIVIGRYKSKSIKINFIIAVNWSSS